MESLETSALLEFFWMKNIKYNSDKLIVFYSLTDINKHTF